MSELKPCPFCGSDNVEISEDDYAPSAIVICPRCKGEGPFCHKQSKETAVEKWNTRTNELVNMARKYSGGIDNTTASDDSQITTTNEKPLDWSKPIQTRDGNKARLLCSNLGGVGAEQSFVVAIMEDGREWVGTRNKDGRKYSSDSDADIINVPEAPKKHAVYVAITHDGNLDMADLYCWTHEGNRKPRAVKRVELVEGEFDE